MVKVAIVDDDIKSKEILEKILHQYEKTKQIYFKISFFSNAIDFISDYKAEFDFILMDIDMPMLNGIEAAKKLRELDKYVSLIFVTNLEQYAVSGFKVKACNYVLKPVNYASFVPVLNDVVDKILVLDKDYLVVNQKSGCKKIYYRDVFYILVNGRYVNLITNQGSIEMHISMKDLEKQLLGTFFVRIDNSAMINLEYVTEINKNGAVVNGQLISCSRNRRKMLIDSFTKYF